MARITMRNSRKATFAEVFEVYISAVTARGVKDKTIATYKQHFHAISKRLDVSMPIKRLTSTVLDNLILPPFDRSFCFFIMALFYQRNLFPSVTPPHKGKEKRWAQNTICLHK